MINDQVPDVLAIWKRVLQRHKSEIEALNKSQLEQGKRADNTSLGGYSEKYKKVRRKFGRPTYPKDLNLTGDFYNGFYSLYFDKLMEIGSKDKKEDILEGIYGEIHGLTPENKDKLLWELGVAVEFIEEYRLELFR